MSAKVMRIVMFVVSSAALSVAFAESGIPDPPALTFGLAAGMALPYIVAPPPRG